MGEPGWWPDPYGTGGQRYFDGAGWTTHYAVPVARDQVYVTGPNHVLHAILTVLTFWACGGWGWVWLLVAMNNKKHVTRY